MTAPPAARHAVPGTGAEAGATATETFIVPLQDDQYLVYAPLRRTAFVANGALVGSIADVQAGRFFPTTEEDRALVRLLGRLGLVGRPDDPPGAIRAGPPRPVEITLLLTTACSLRCTYCYAAAGDTPVQRMPLAVAQRGIRYVLANAVEVGSPTITVNYHGGGEPTAAWAVMTRSLEFARAEAEARGISVVAAAATNGVLGDRQVDWIVANLDGGITVSFDGLPEIHDRYRVTARGRGSSSRVMRTMRRMDAAGYEYGVRVTVTPDHVARLADSIAFICAHFRPSVIQVEPAYRLGRWRAAPTADTEEFVAAFREAQGVAAGHDRTLTYSAARSGLMTSHFCGVSQDNFCLSPSGNVTACYEAFSEADALAAVFFYGRAGAESGYEFDGATLDRLRRRAVPYLDWCRGCFAKWDCAGDCYYKALATDGSGAYRGSQRCHITRELTKDQLLERIRDAGGVLWHEPPDGAPRRRRTRSPRAQPLDTHEHA